MKWILLFPWKIQKSKEIIRSISLRHYIIITIITATIIIINPIYFSLYLSSLWQLIRPDAFLFEIDSHALEHFLHRNMNLIDLQTFTGFHQLGVV